MRELASADIDRVQRLTSTMSAGRINAVLVQRGISYEMLSIAYSHAYIEELRGDERARVDEIEQTLGLGD